MNLEHCQRKLEALQTNLNTVRGLLAEIESELNALFAEMGIAKVLNGSTADMIRKIGSVIEIARAAQEISDRDEICVKAPTE